jgi:hypothetical protein
MNGIKGSAVRLVLLPAFAGMAVTLCPVVREEREQPHVHFEEYAPVNFIGRAAVAVVSTTSQPSVSSFIRAM